MTDYMPTVEDLTIAAPSTGPNPGRAEHVRLVDIRTDGGTQMRARLDEATVADYVEVIYADRHKEGGPFPPITVFYDGQSYWLADGFHRVAAWRKFLRIEEGEELHPKNPAGMHTIAAIVHAGDRRAAALFAAGANASHGLRRTNADKRRAVETLLRDDEWGKWSDREIARRCAVSHTFVSDLRGTISGNECQIPTERRVTRKGTAYAMQTANIGQHKLPIEMTDDEQAIIDREVPPAQTVYGSPPDEAPQLRLVGPWHPYPGPDPDALEKTLEAERAEMADAVQAEAARLEQRRDEVTAAAQPVYNALTRPEKLHKLVAAALTFRDEFMPAIGELTGEHVAVNRARLALDPLIESLERNLVPYKEMADA